MAKRRWVPRFSLRTLILFACLAGGAYGLWLRWEPWVPTGIRITDGAGMRNVLFSPDGRRAVMLATVPRKDFNFDSTIEYRFFDTDTGKKFATQTSDLACSPFNFTMGVRLSPDGQWYHAYAHQSIVHWEGVWRLEDGEPALEVDADGVSSIAYSPKGRFLILYGYLNSNGARVVEANSDKVVLKLDDTQWFQISFSGDEAFAAVQKGGVVTVYETAHWTPIYGPFLDLAQGTTFEITLNYDGSLILVEDGAAMSAEVFAADSGTSKFKFTGYIPRADGVNGSSFLDDQHPGFCSSYFSPDGRTLATFDSQTIWLWRCDTGQRKAVIPWEPYTRESGTAFNRDGNRLVVCAPGQEMGVWDTESGKKVWGMKARVTASPDAETVIECGDGYFSFRHAADGSEFYRSPPFQEAIQFGYLSEDGQRLLVGNNDALSMWERRRPEQWEGLFQLPELWVTAVFGVLVLWSLIRDRRTLRAN